jgi:hypothetical protein
MPNFLLPKYSQRHKTALVKCQLIANWINKFGQLEQIKCLCLLVHVCSLAMCTWPPYLKMLFAHADQTLFFTGSAQAALKREGTHTHIQQLDKPLTSWPDEILTRPLESVLPKKGNPDPPTESEPAYVWNTRGIKLPSRRRPLKFRCEWNSLLLMCVCVWLFPILNVSGTRGRNEVRIFFLRDARSLLFFFHILKAA